MTEEEKAKKTKKVMTVVAISAGVFGLIVLVYFIATSFYEDEKQ